MIETIIIVGASHAGVQAVDSLRREGFTGHLILIGAETHLPYQRPPLSKKFLSGELPLDRLVIRQTSFYEQHQVDLRLNTRVTAIDSQKKTVTLNDSNQLHYDKLILCVGSRVRQLTCPGADLNGVHYLRTAADVDNIKLELSAGKRMVIIGAGYIGLEVAATTSKLGLNVTVLEMADRCLNRVTAPVVSEFYAQRHAQAGVRLITNTRVDALISIAGESTVQTVRCADGTHIPADIVIVGVGIIPETDVAQTAGLKCDNGIVVDEHCSTSDANIYAAGDCTNHPSVRYGVRVRLESVDNALEQARVAAGHICGKDAQHAHTPWFWSDQYDVKLQTAGLMQGNDQQIIRGDPASGQFSVWYLKAGELLAVDAVNRAGDFILGKKWVGERKHPDATALADTTVDLKTL